MLNVFVPVVPVVLSHSNNSCHSREFKPHTGCQGLNFYQISHFVPYFWTTTIIYYLFIIFSWYMFFRLLNLSQDYSKFLGIRYDIWAIPFGLFACFGIMPFYMAFLNN